MISAADREAETGAAGGPLIGQAAELLEDEFLGITGHAGTVVDEVDRHPDRRGRG